MARQRHETHVGVNVNDNLGLKGQLISEITHLERELEHMELTELGMVDFSMLQTYKEMIHSRRDMLSSFPLRH